MRAKIVIGSIFSVCILMLVPAISAVQLDTTDTVQEPKVDREDWPPLLEIFVKGLFNYWNAKAEFWNDLADVHYTMEGMQITHPLAYLRAVSFYLKALIWYLFWEPRAYYRWGGW